MKNSRVFEVLIMMILAGSALADQKKREETGVPHKLSTYQQGLAFLRTNKIADAKVAFEDYIATDPSPQRLYDVANAYADYKQWARAAQYFEQVTKQLPASHQAWIELGLSHFEDKKIDPALEALKTAVTNAKKNARPYVVLANVYEKLGNRYEARIVYQDMIKQKIETAFAFSRLCHSFAVESYFDEALKNCNKALELDPKDMNSLVTLGKMLVDKGSKGEGMFKLAKAIALFPKEAMAYRVRGQIYLNDGNHTLARKDLGRALALDPKDGESAVGLGVALFESGLYDQALIAFTEAAHIDRKYLQEFSRRQRMLSIKREVQAASKFNDRLSQL